LKEGSVQLLMAVIGATEVESSVVAMSSVSASRWAAPASAGRRRRDRRRSVGGWSARVALVRALAGRLSPRASSRMLDIRHTTWSHPPRRTR